MDVLLTGAYGQCGTAVLDHLGDEHDITPLDRVDPPRDHRYGKRDTIVADVADFDAIRRAFDGRDAVVHLAAHPTVESTFGDVLEPNIVGVNNVLEAAREAGTESVIFASTNHVLGMYEREHAPELYQPGYGLVLDRDAPIRPDSHYGASKAFGEALGRFYVERYEYPKRFYAVRIGSVRWHEYDHPYGDAERGVDEGNWTRDSEEYERQVARMKATWQSRRDFAHEIDCCLRDDSVEFDVFSGVSDNQRRWFDLEHARSVIEYRPRDDAEEWDGPPS